jgi:acetyltransferase-like isoleucine patch superfamily enzyme
MITAFGPQLYIPYLVQLIRANIKLLMGFKAPQLLFMEPRAVVHGLPYIKIGPYARLKHHSRLHAYDGGSFIIGPYFSLGDFSIIENSYRTGALTGIITIGSNVGIGAFSFISCPSRIVIGDDCIIGQYFSIHAQNHIYEGNKLIRLQGTNEIGVVIGKNCWIGSKVTILDGVTIGHSCVIAAGSVVNKSFPPRTLVGGCPAKILRTF